MNSEVDGTSVEASVKVLGPAVAPKRADSVDRDDREELLEMGPPQVDLSPEESSGREHNLGQHLRDQVHWMAYAQ